MKNRNSLSNWMKKGASSEGQAWSKREKRAWSQNGRMLEEAAIEHPFSTLSAPFGTTRKEGGNQCPSSMRSWTRLAAMLILLFTIGVGQMWANGGIGYKGVKFKKNGSTTGWYNIHNVSWDYSNASYECRSGQSGVTDFNNASLGTVTTLKLEAFVVIGWTDGSDYVAGQLKYRLYLQSASAGSYSTYDIGNYSNPSWGATDVLVTSGNNRVVGKSSSMNMDIVTGSTAPGNYYLQLQGMGRMQYTGGGGGSFNANNGSEVKATLTVPGFATTSTSNAYGNVEVGSYSSTTISFTQHYGTTLTTSDCSLTNSTDFQVTGISETGVTVKFIPQTTGNKSCTLTITDANSKTCEISLTGTGTAPAETTHSVTVSYVCPSTSATVSSATTPDIGEETYSEQTAPTVAGYTFANWTLGTGVAKHASDELTSNPIRVKTNSSGSGYTLTANYTEDLSSPWTLKGGTNLTGNNWATAYNLTKKSGHSTESVAYYTLNISSTNSGVSGAADDWSFKLINSSWYGLSADGSYWWQRSTTANQTLSTSGQNIQICADVAGPYEIKVDYTTPASPKVTVTFPTSYTLTYSIGDVAGNDGSISSSPTTSSGSKVLSGNTVTLTAPNAKSGYTWKGWYLNADGSGVQQCSTKAYDVTMDADKTLYACYTENNYTVTVNAGAGGSVASTSVTGHKDTKVTLPTATANPGYYFTGWTTTSGSLSYDNQSSATAAKVYNLTAAATVQANFSPIWRVAYSGDTYNTENHQITNITTSAGVMTSGSVTISLNANTDYALKVYNKSTDKWWGHDGGVTKITYTNKGTAQSLSENTGSNQTFRTAGKGTYTFTWDVSNSKISVGYPTSYTVTFGKGTGGSSVSASVESSGAITSGQYAASGKDITFTQTPATGYTFKGWYTASSGGLAIACMASDNVYDDIAANINVYAQYNAKTYTVTLDQQTSATGYGSSGSTSLTATYDAAFPSATMPTAAAGYAFMGYYSATGGGGTQFTDASGNLLANITGYSDASGHWKYDDDDLTLYAYYKKAEITALTLDATVVEINGTVGVTPTISPTPTGDYKLCFYVFHGNDNPLDPQPEISWNGTKATFGAGATSGTFKIGVSLRTGSSCGGGTLLDSTTVSYQVAGVHTVTVRYKCGDDVIKASTSLEGIRPLDWSADVTAPTITGYSFTQWEAGDGVTIKDAAGSDKTTSTYQTIQIKAVYDGYLTAKYSKKRVIYFNNTLNWDTVVVYFYKNDSYWDDSKGTGANTSFTYTDTPYGEGKHGGMQRVASGSNIWYFDAEAAGVNSSYTNVAFTDKEQHGYDFFYDDVNVVRRGDYYSTKLPMFVPVASQTPTNKNSNKAHYYNEGYWMNYPENTGYTLKIYNQKAEYQAVELKSIPFEFAENKAMPMELNVDLEAGQTYGFKIYRNDGLNAGAGSFYGNTGTMTADAEGWAMTTGTGTNTGLQTTAAGTYKFLLNYYAVSSTYQYRVSVTYPVASGDYRLLYKDDVHTAWHPSAVIAKANAKDTVSFFVRTGQHAYLKLQKCTGLGAGTVTWSDTVTWWDNGSGIPAAVTKDSVYNICLKHNASNGKLEIEKVEAYTGNYYIRVDAANSKWDNYRTDPDHLMTYSEYSITHGGYSHYYTHWVTTDDRKNIKFVIANDYSPCISDTLIRENASGEWENIGTFIDSNGDIKRNANVRFMWYQHDNTIKRAYVDGAQEDGSEFLLMLNTDATAKIKWADGSALTDKKVTFSDNGNWIYEANVQAQPNAKIRLKSTWGEGTTIVQYFKGSSSTSEDLIGGSGDDWYPIRVLYDFKTNRIVASYVPATGTINSDVQINADVMFIREHQGDIAQLTFGVSGSISKIETAYGVLRFNKWTINNKDKSTHSPLATPKSRYERDLFYISFPFKVSLEEVFGFGTYGTHWIIEYYDGAARAREGFWAETPTFWRFITNRKGVFLEPNVGYLLALDLDELGESSSVWANTENVELYFPSYGSMPTITSSSVEHTLPDHECTINRPTPDGNRTIKDSHWNIMSVPTYVNTNNVTFANDTWTASKPSFLYTWNMDDNTLTATSGKGYTYKAMHAYTVQYYGKVTWTTSVSPSSIVAHRTYAEAPSEVEFCLELQQNENMIDRTFVRMSNDADVDAEFVFGEDMSKDLNRNKANIYTKVTTLMDDELTVTEVAGNCLPMSEQTTVVPMGIMTPNAGTYTIAIPSGTSGVGVTLIDNETGIRTNLALMDYTVDLDAATYDDRFVLEISPMKHLTTDIEGVDDGQDEKIRKVLIDQQMYIIKDKTVFDARGARVK